MGYEWHDLVGNIGVLFILFTYLALQLERINPTGIPYSALNGVGALFILVTLFFDFNLSAFLIELAWLLISLFGLWRCFTARKSAPSTDD